MAFQAMAAIVGLRVIIARFEGYAAVYLQESVKARHPQLLYESKLYKILQGGGKALVHRT